MDNLSLACALAGLLLLTTGLVATFGWPIACIVDGALLLYGAVADR